MLGRLEPVCLGETVEERMASFGFTVAAYPTGAYEGMFLDGQ